MQLPQATQRWGSIFIGNWDYSSGGDEPQRPQREDEEYGEKTFDRMNRIHWIFRRLIPRIPFILSKSLLRASLRLLSALEGIPIVSAGPALDKYGTQRIW